MRHYLLLIDFIADLVGAEPWAGEIRRGGVLEHAAAVLAKARAAKVPIGHVRVAFSAPDMPEAPAHSPLFDQFRGSGALQIGAPGVEFDPAVAPVAGEAIILKHQVSPFWKTALDAELARHAVTDLTIVGISTTLAVSSAVREAHDRGFAVTLVTDACASHDRAAHAAELGALAPLCRQLTSEEVSF